MMNKNVGHETFSKVHKNTDVTTVLKKTNAFDLKTPVLFYKIFEKLMQKQIMDYIKEYLSPLLYEYRKYFSTKTFLLCLIKKWKFT